MPTEDEKKQMERDQILTNNIALLVHTAETLPGVAPEQLHLVAEKLVFVARSIACCREYALMPSDKVMAAIESRSLKPEHLN